MKVRRCSMWTSKALTGSDSAPRTVELLCWPIPRLSSDAHLPATRTRSTNPRDSGGAPIHPRRVAGCARDRRDLGHELRGDEERAAPLHALPAGSRALHLCRIAAAVLRAAAAAAVALGRAVRPGPGAGAIRLPLLGA